MTPIEMREARRKLGMSTGDLADALRMRQNGARTVRRWESGELEVPGPAVVAIEAMLRERGESGALTLDAINVRIRELRMAMTGAKVWPARELREFLFMVRERERELRAME